jgi:acyl-CoA synthetase (AMP-forming)/AMP-acid ligase II
MLQRPSVHYPRLLFHELLERAADLHGESHALLHGSSRVTFRELDGWANSSARALQARGVGPGARVGLYSGNRREWIVSLFAILKAGASAVLLSPAYRHGELEHALSLTDPSFLIVDERLSEHVERAGFSGPTLQLPASEAEAAAAYRELVARWSGARLELALDPETSEALLPFSSGTTGLPKAVRHTHRSLVVSSLQWKIALGLGPSDCLQTFTPLAHMLGVANLGAGIAAGARHRLFERFDADLVLHGIQEDRVTVGIAVAPVALALANHPSLERFDLRSLRFFDWCATPVAADVASRFTDRTGVRWHTAYGCSEAPVLTANPVNSPELWRLDSPGLPGCDVEMRILDLASHEPLPPGESGEVVVRGPNLMRGYLPEAANAEAFLPGGWYRTGDIGWLEPEGWLHLTDRLKEMIKVAGFQVAPAEVEGVLLGHEAVSDCAVFGVADAARGQVPRAAVVLRPGAAASAEALIDRVKRQLASYKSPVRIDFVDEIPRTASGKALRRVLVERFGAIDPARAPR